jgi:hypothetical protein
VIATTNHNLKIDLQRTTLNDFAGRTQFLTNRCMPIRELVQPCFT